MCKTYFAYCLIPLYSKSLIKVYVHIATYVHTSDLNGLRIAESIRSIMFLWPSHTITTTHIHMGCYISRLPLCVDGIGTLHFSELYVRSYYCIYSSCSFRENRRPIICYKQRYHHHRSSQCGGHLDRGLHACGHPHHSCSTLAQAIFIHEECQVRTHVRTQAMCIFYIIYIRKS